MKDKKIPQNIEAEQAVLASMFLSKYALEKACDNLAPEKFYDENGCVIGGGIIKSPRSDTYIQV